MEEWDQWRANNRSLETMRQIAIVESTEASNRIEGITVPADRVKALMARADRAASAERTA